MQTNDWAQLTYPTAKCDVQSYLNHW